jgi:hypothetical protein
MQHLDSREWLQRGREVTDDELCQGEDLTGHIHPRRKILKIDSSRVVKLSPDLDMAEVDNLAFIRSHTAIPVPRVFNAYEKEGRWYIIMEFIEGGISRAPGQSFPLRIVNLSATNCTNASFKCAISPHQ